jgi:hypothetical protein
LHKRGKKERFVVFNQTAPIKMLPELYLNCLNSQFYWQFLSHTGSSNLATQQALLRPVLRLLKGYELVVIGDREFRSVELVYWLKQKKVYFALRQKQGNYIKRKGQDYQQLSELGLAPGMKLFLTGVNFTKKKGFGQFSLAAYWKRKYRGKGSDEGWYILTNLKSSGGDKRPKSQIPQESDMFNSRAKYQAS